MTALLTHKRLYQSLKQLIFLHKLNDQPFSPINQICLLLEIFIHSGDKSRADNKKMQLYKVPFVFYSRDYSTQWTRWWAHAGMGHTVWSDNHLYRFASSWVFLLNYGFKKTISRKQKCNPVLWSLTLHRHDKFPETNSMSTYYFNVRKRNGLFKRTSATIFPFESYSYFPVD